MQLLRGVRALVTAALFGAVFVDCFSPAASPTEMAAPIQARLVSGPTGNQLSFHTDTDPWTGFGALQH